MNVYRIVGPLRLWLLFVFMVCLIHLSEAGRSIDKDDDGTVCCKCHRADQPELVS